MIICNLETEGINPFPTKKNDISNATGKFKAGFSRIVGNAFMHSEEKRTVKNFTVLFLVRNTNLLCFSII